MERRLKVLWVPDWYPSRVDPLNGDFIQRHARAVSRFADVTVIFAIKDGSAAATEICKYESHGLTEYIAYYPSKGNGPLQRLSSVKKRLKLFNSLYASALEEAGRFDLIHMHISGRQGIFVRSLKQKYILSEQSSRFMRGTAASGFVERWLDTKNYKHAAAVHTVSSSLCEKLKELGHVRDCTVIPNTVNTDVFKPAENAPDLRKHFSAVTGNVYHKNTDGILRAFAKLLARSPDSMLHLAGPVQPVITELISELNISAYVILYGPVSNETVADIMRSTGSFIFFTRYETFGCVMAEALCCGLPVIAADIPVLRENLDASNSVFVDPENEQALTDAMLLMRERSFKSEVIAREAAKKYAFDNIGSQLMELYYKIM